MIEAVASEPETLVADVLSPPDQQTAGVVRTPGNRLSKAVRALSPRETLFVQGYVRHQGDIRLSSLDAGFSPNHGYKIVKEARVQTAIQQIVRQAEKRIGVDLSKSRMLEDLDRALRRVAYAFDREAEVRGRCPKCETSVTVKIRAAPREVAALGVAVARATEVAAKITGAMAPAKIQHSRGPDVEGSYTGLVRLVQENPKAFTPAQQQELHQTALADRLAIDVLLSLLAIQVQAIEAH